MFIRAAAGLGNLGCKLFRSSGYDFNSRIQLPGRLYHSLGFCFFGHMLCFGGFGHGLVSGFCLFHSFGLTRCSQGKAFFQLIAHFTHGGKQSAILAATIQGHVYLKITTRNFTGNFCHI